LREKIKKNTNSGQNKINSTQTIKKPTATTKKGVAHATGSSSSSRTPPLYTKIRATS
jgi:hypothetical protein